MKYLAQPIPGSTGFSRRALMRGSAASLLLAPFSKDRRASAQQEATAPKNLVVVTWPEGLEDGWQASGGETSFQLGSVAQALTPFQNDCVFFEGITSGYNVFEALLAHNLGTISLWTGARSQGGGLQELSGHPSIDQLVAERFARDTAYRSLHFGAQTNRYSFISTPYVHFSGAQQAVPAEDDPNVMYNQIFGSLTGDPAAADRLKRRRASVLDFVRKDIARVEAEITAADRPKMQAHLAGIEGIERSLSSLGAECAAKPNGDLVSREAALLDENFEKVIRLQADLLSSALQCGLTRVATLQLGNTDCQVKLPSTGTARSVHEAQHDGTLEDRIAWGKFFVAQLAYLVGRLKAIEAGPGRTLLDDTLVVMGSEMGIGTHAPDPVPFMLAGGGGTRIKLGRYLKLPQQQQHTRFLVTVLHAMGLTDVTSLGDFGQADQAGPIPGVLS